MDPAPMEPTSRWPADSRTRRHRVAGPSCAPRTAAARRGTTCARVRVRARLVIPLLVCFTALAAALSGAAGAAQDAAQEAARDRAPHGRLFPPEDLGLLEGPDREAWQQPERIMDLLRIADGATVADIGAGGGWFTVRLARRVGPNGLVYAEDIQPQMLGSINRRVRREGLANVRTIHGTPTDPLLPSPVDAVLIVDVYAAVAVEDRIPLLRNLVPLLAPGGRVGIVDFKLDGGGPGPPLAERVEPEAVVRDARAAGLRLREREDLRYQYVLVFVADAR